MLKIFFASPSLGKRSDLQTYAMRAIEEKYKDKVKIVYPDKLVQRIFHDFARNGYVEQFLATDCDIIWFLDSDVSPPEHILDLVVEHGDKWDLAGAPYPIFMTPSGYDGPQVVFTVYKNTDGRLFHASVPRDGIDYVDGVATGCIFIKRDVFNKLTKPYFEFKYDNETRQLTEGEDLGFCKKVNELGYKFFIDYSMVCKHFKEVELLEVNNYAIQYANTAILEYDRVVRSQVTRAKLGLNKPKSNLILP